MENQLKTIQFILGSIQIIDIIVSMFLYFTYGKNKLYLYAFFLWIGSFFFFLTDFGLGPVSGEKHVMFSFSWNLLCAFSITRIISTLFNVSLDWKYTLRINAFLITLSAILCMSDINDFWIYSLPMVIAISWPVLYLAFIAFKKARKIDRFYLLASMTWALHNLDYPFLRPLNHLEFSIFGFSFALILTYLMSILVPVVINQSIYRNINDILDQKLAEKTSELELSRKKMIESEKMAALSTLSIGFAHEIKNPLNIISASNAIGEQFSTDYSNPSKLNEFYSEDLTHMQEAVQDSKTAVDRVSKLIQSILDVGSPSTKDFTRVDLQDVININFNLITKSQQGEDKLDVRKDFRLDQCPAIKGDPGDLNRVFINLFENSLYSLKKKKQAQPDFVPKIEIVYTHSLNEVIIHYKDNGLGMSPDVMQQVFDPFFTTKKGKEGSGLGMYLVSDIIKKHSGTINIESVENEYASFIIKFNKG